MDGPRDRNHSQKIKFRSDFLNFCENYESLSYPFDYEKRSDSSPAPIVPFNNLLKGGIRRLYLQRFGNARTNRKWFCIIENISFI